jgi:hypothetical protein
VRTDAAPQIRVYIQPVGIVTAPFTVLDADSSLHLAGSAHPEHYEHFFTRGTGLAMTRYLKNHTIYDSEAALELYFLRLAGKDAVRVSLRPCWSTSLP